jgi:hypothetical protein
MRRRIRTPDNDRKLKSKINKRLKSLSGHFYGYALLSVYESLGYSPSAESSLPWVRVSLLADVVRAKDDRKFFEDLSNLDFVALDRSRINDPLVRIVPAVIPRQKLWAA